ncbi:MAG: hypothetical protein J3K34DRAFT_417781 [Monoraphidium minutum]|nr:MAG: hypothetical protein J3K34DRAFT_417781 [Monoraphidium minutum]
MDLDGQEDSLDADFEQWLASAFGSADDDAGSTDQAGRGRRVRRWRAVRGGAGDARGEGASEQGDVSAGGSVHPADETEGTGGSAGCGSTGGPAPGDAGTAAAGDARAAARSRSSGRVDAARETAQQRAHRMFYERKKERLSSLLADAASKRVQVAQLAAANAELRRRAAALELLLAAADRHLTLAEGAAGAARGTAGAAAAAAAAATAGAGGWALSVAEAAETSVSAAAAAAAVADMAEVADRRRLVEVQPPFTAMAEDGPQPQLQPQKPPPPPQQQQQQQQQQHQHQHQQQHTEVLQPVLQEGRAARAAAGAPPLLPQSQPRLQRQSQPQPPPQLQQQEQQRQQPEQQGRQAARMHADVLLPPPPPQPPPRVAGASLQGARSHSIDLGVPTAHSPALPEPPRSYSADWVGAPWGRGGSGGTQRGTPRHFVGWQVTTEGPGLIRTASSGAPATSDDPRYLLSGTGCSRPASAPCEGGGALKRIAFAPQAPKLTCSARSSCRP